MTDSCQKCKKRVGERTGIKCELCEDLFHVNCTDLNVEQQRSFATCKFPYTCLTCKNLFVALKTQNSELTNKVSLLKNNNASLQTRVGMMEEQFERLKRDIKNEILTEMRQQPNSTAPQISSISEQVQAMVTEERDREKRKLNLCIFNMSETSEEATDELTNLKGFLHAKLDISQGEINPALTKVIRIGTRSNDKARAMILTCANSDIKRKILKNAYKLKSFRTDANKKVFIVPDMTKVQREDDKKLKDELWRRRNQGEEVTIRRGKIVQSSRNPENGNQQH